jgi:hypothetical protein
MSLFGGFVNSMLLWGTTLAAVPLVIHLLNRQRHKPMQWAAMRFVIAAYRKTRRRVQMENLLLLLLRMAAVALLAFALARPFTGRLSPLAGFTESRRDVILVLDGSASTGYRESVDTVFDRAVARARVIVRELDGGRGDRVRMILAGGYPRLLSWTQPDQASAMLDTLSAPTDETLDLAGALGEVLRFAREDAAAAGHESLEIRLLSDMQRRSFVPPTEVAGGRASSHSGAATTAAPVAGAPTGGAAGAAPNAANPSDRPALFDQLDELATLGLKVIVEDLGPSQTQPHNLGIASVKPLGPVLGAGLPVDLSVSVQNHGGSAKSGVRVALDVDGERRPVAVIDVPARGRADAVFQVVFKAPGEHVLVAHLEGDALAVDDARAEILSVPPPASVLLVNGAPGATIDEDETGYLAAVLEPQADDGSAVLSATAPFEPRVIEPDLLSTTELDLSSFDVIWLANVESVSAAAVERLEHQVAAGSALIVSLGDRVIPESYNTRLYRADQSGLLPAELKRRVSVPSRRDGYFRVKSFEESNPALSFFADDRWKPLFTEVPIYEFVAVRPTASAHVLATLDDEGSHPLLIERAYDRGRVFLWTTSIDPAWTRLPESPRTLVPLVHELVRYATREAEPPRNVAPGTALSAEALAFPHNTQLALPDGSRRALDGEPEPLANGRYRLPSVPGKDSERVGLYRIEMEGAPTLHFAVQLDASEGDLERLSSAELEGLHRSFVAFKPDDKSGGGAGGEAPHKGELWRGLALACFIALVLESLWAAWLGQRRRSVIR